MTFFNFVLTEASTLVLNYPKADATVQVQQPDGTYIDLIIADRPVKVGPGNVMANIPTSGTYRIRDYGDCDGNIHEYEVRAAFNGGAGGGGGTVTANNISLAIGDAGQVVRVDATTTPATTTLLDGTPYVGGLTLDVEYKTDVTCLETIAETPARFSRITCFPVDDPSQIAIVWLDENGALATPPTDPVRPCDSAEILNSLNLIASSNQAIQAQAVTRENDRITNESLIVQAEINRDQAILAELQEPLISPISVRECVGDSTWRLRGWNVNSVTHADDEPFLNIFSTVDEHGLPFIRQNPNITVGRNPDIDVRLADTEVTQADLPFVNNNIQFILEGYIIAPEVADFIVSWSDNTSNTGRFYVGTSPDDVVLLADWNFGSPQPNAAGNQFNPFRAPTNACDFLYIRLYITDEAAPGTPYQSLFRRDSSAGPQFQRISSTRPDCQSTIQWIEEGNQPVLTEFQQIGQCDSEQINLALALVRQTNALKTPSPLVTEVYQLYGDSIVRTESTASTGPGSVPNIGTDLTITGPYQSLAWRFTRRSRLDPGDGSVGSVNVNGFDYFPGRDAANNQNPYGQDGFSVSSVLPGEQLTTDFEFIANGLAGIEVIVTREA